MTLKMTSAQVVETSVIVNNNSSFQNYTNPDDHTQQTTDTPGFKPFTKYTLFGRIIDGENTRTHLNVQFKPVEGQSIPDTNTTKSYRDLYLLPLKTSSYVKFGCWSQNHLNNFTEFVVFTVLW